MNRHRISVIFIILALLATSISYSEESVSPLERVEYFYKLILNENFKDRIGTDIEKQNEWLSKDVQILVKTAECDARRAEQEESRPLDWVNAEIFFDRWDIPSYCKSISSERINNDYKVHSECTWGKGKDHPAGTVIEIFAIVVMEQSKWKIANIVHGKQEFDKNTTSNDLIKRLSNAANQSEHPDVCKKQNT